jgi:hypothetical protein
VVIRINTLFGKLNIPESKWGYYIFDTRTIDISNTNISEILEDIYYNTKKSFIEIQIEEYNLVIGKWSDAFRAKGMLFLERNSFGLYDWHIGKYKDNQDLGSFLFNNTGKSFRIKIRSYIRRYQKEQVNNSKENKDEKNKDNS